MDRNHTIKACLPNRQAFIIILFIVTCTTSFAQNNYKTDSLKNLLKTVNINEKAKLLNELAKAYLPDFPQKTKEIASLALQYAKKQNNKNEQAFALKNIGLSLYYQSKHEQALEHYNNSIHIFKELDNKPKIAKLFNNIGVINYELNNYEKALEYYQKSLKIEEEIKNKNGIARSLNNIGIIHCYLNNYEDALECFQKSLKVEEDIKDKRGIAYSLNNIGIIYKDLNNYKDALEYHQKSLKIKEEIKDKRGIAYSLNNIGIIYKELNNYEDALEYYQKSLRIKEEIKDKRGMASSLNNIGELYNKFGKFSEALLYFGKSLEISKTLNTKDIIIDSYKLYSESYSATGNYKKAFEYYKQYTGLKDSVFSLETHKQIAYMKTKYETEKKEKEILLLQKEQELQLIRLEQQNTALQRSKIQKLMLVILLLVLSVLGYLLYNRRVLKHKELRNREKIKHREEQLHVVIETQENERKRFTSDLHDGLGQIISALRMNLCNLEPGKILPNTQKTEVYNNSITVLNDIVTELRNISFDIMPQTLIKDGLIASLNELIKKVNISQSIKVELITFGHNGRLNSFTEIALYRIIQELLNNIFKYSQASNVCITLTMHEKELNIMIEDDGIGFDINKSKTGKGRGLININSRIKLLKGSIETDTHPGKQGTTVIIDMPVPTHMLHC